MYIEQAYVTKKNKQTQTANIKINVTRKTIF